MGKRYVRIITIYGNVTGPYLFVGGIVGEIGAAASGSGVCVTRCYSSGAAPTSGTHRGILVGCVSSGGWTLLSHYTGDDDNTLNVLGAAFGKDVKNINNGYPILNWENEKYNN